MRSPSQVVHLKDANRALSGNMTVSNLILKYSRLRPQLLQRFSVEVGVGTDGEIQNLLKHSNHFDLPFDVTFDKPLLA